MEKLAVIAETQMTQIAQLAAFTGCGRRSEEQKVPVRWSCQLSHFLCSPNRGTFEEQIIWNPQLEKQDTDFTLSLKRQNDLPSSLSSAGDTTDMA